MYRLSPIILSYAHRLRVSAGLPMHTLSPIILGCASSPSRFSWFVHAPLISNNFWLCLIVFAFQLVTHAPLIANNSWLCLIVFAFQLVWPCTAYRQQFLAAPSHLHVSVGLPMYLLSLVIHAQTNTNTPRCLLRSVVNDNTAAYLRHRGAIKIQAYYLVCP